MSIFTALCGGLVGFVIAAYFLLSHFSNRIRLSMRAGLYMWMLLFGSIFAMLIGFVDLAKLAINTPLSGSEPTPTRAIPTRQIPTMTSVPTRPASSGNECTLWSKVTASMNGEKLKCVYGNVTDYVENLSLNATYFYFGTREQFFFVASDIFFPDFEDGDCAQASGVVQLNAYGTPYIKIDELLICD